MTILRLINSDPIGAVWVDARFSNGGVPYGELTQLPGFPRWLEFDESVEVEAESWKEVLYRRSNYPRKAGPDHGPLSSLWRINMNSSTPTKIGRLFPTGFHKVIIGANDPEADPYADLTNTLKLTPPVEILSKSCHSTRKYEIEPSLKFDGFAENIVQVFVKITDKTNGDTGIRMIVEADNNQARAVCHKFRIKGDKLLVSPRMAGYDGGLADYYREQGFSVPLQIPLSDIFQILVTGETSSANL